MKKHNHIKMKELSIKEIRAIFEAFYKEDSTLYKIMTFESDNLEASQIAHIYNMLMCETPSIRELTALIVDSYMNDYDEFVTWCAVFQSMFDNDEMPDEWYCVEFEVMYDLCYLLHTYVRDYVEMKPGQLKLSYDSIRAIFDMRHALAAILYNSEEAEEKDMYATFEIYMQTLDIVTSAISDMKWKHIIFKDD